MGTNYYADEMKPCPNCDREHMCQSHIGKSSGGWKFLFSTEGDFEELNFASFKQWLEGRTIRNEYDEEITHKEFWEMVERKQKEARDHLSDTAHCVILDGYAFMKGYFS